MTDPTTAAPGIGSPAPLGLGRRIVDVIFSPGETYRSAVMYTLRTAPTAWSPLVVYFVLAVIFAAVRVAMAGA